MGASTKGERSPNMVTAVGKKSFQLKVSEIFEFNEHQNICTRFGFMSVNGRFDTEKNYSTLMAVF